ncbi:MAG TPA: M3 family metallopeptidase, partial [Albitalea sp.]|nr:M3 family metallopeptidase [Albitalea sp.]
MRSMLVAALIGASALSQARAEPLADRWNLADVYATPAAWDADATLLETQIGRFADCKGHLGDSAARLRQCLDLRAEVQKRLYRLSLFASQTLAEDTGVPASQLLQQRVELLENKLDEAGAFVDPELLRIGAARIAGFVSQDAALRVHRFPLDRTLRAAPHTLNDAGETLVARFGKMSGTGGSVYSTFSNADMPWPKLKLASGEEITLDQSAYTKYRESPQRDERKRVMDSFFGTWKTYERTLGGLLYAQLKQDNVYAAVRKYPDSITRALDRDRIPVAVVDTLIRETNAHLPTLHRYFRLRAKMLGVKEMRYYDIYPPLVHGEYKFPLATAKQLTLEAV